MLKFMARACANKRFAGLMVERAAQNAGHRDALPSPRFLTLYSLANQINCYFFIEVGAFNTYTV